MTVHVNLVVDFSNQQLETTFKIGNRFGAGNALKANC